MSAFTETALLKKLQELNSSQQSIQTLSLWLIHHRKHHSAIIKTWYRELLTAPEMKKLTFMYLANDVIQNSKKKGPEYGREFSIILHKVFTHIGEVCKTEKLFAGMSRILKIWEDRFVYEQKTIDEYRVKLNLEKFIGSNKETQQNGDDAPTDGKENPKVSEKHEKPERQDKHEKHERQEKHEKLEKEKRKHDDAKSKSKRARTSSGSDEKKKHSESNGSGSSSTNDNATVVSVNLSPHIPLGEPPESEELIKALTDIENSASSDAVVRERIANLPTEISEISCLSKLEDKDAAKALAKQVNEAVQLLNDYNSRLATEMEDRTKLTTMLRDFNAEQKELLAQAEQRLEEYKQKLDKMKVIQKEINDHLSNLPDLTSLPDVTGGLAPLPSAGDLFNIH